MLKVTDVGFPADDLALTVLSAESSAFCFSVDKSVVSPSGREPVAFGSAGQATGGGLLLGAFASFRNETLGSRSGRGRGGSWSFSSCNRSQGCKKY